MAKKPLSASELKLKKMATLAMATFATKQETADLEQRLQMQVEGLPYVGFDYDFDNGDLIIDYIEGTHIIEDNFNFDDGDIIITTTPT